MTREWQIIWDNREVFALGLWNTVALTVAATAGSLILGALFSPALMSDRRYISLPAHAFVDLMRCMPFLLFAYVIYYGLPSFGIRLGNWQAGLLALTLYNIAYMAEAFRAGWSDLPRDLVEAGRAFGFSGFPLVTRIILPPIALRILPIIGNQTIQILKDSSFLTIIAVPELTHTANAIQSNYYIPFSSFVVAVLLYWGLCLIVEQATSRLEVFAEARR
jgi:polar amino acid transport system permease protein